MAVLCNISIKISSDITPPTSQSYLARWFGIHRILITFMNEGFMYHARQLKLRNFNSAEVGSPV
jgi:hypothetical protein